MIQIKSYLVSFALTLVLSQSSPLIASDDNESSRPPEKTVTPIQVDIPVADVKQLATQLTDDQFVVREAATRKLSQLGAAVVESITAVALQEHLEGGLRAVSILETLYLSDDEAAFDSAESSLKRLMAESKSPAVARKAAQTLDDNQFTVTQRRAIAEIRRLGGQVQMQKDFPVIINGEQIRPEQGWAQAAAIGKHWKGGDEGLKHLARLKTLQTVYLVGGHSLSDEGIRDLQNELPDVVFQNRGRAMLGVGTRQDTLGCAVSMVRPDSAAGNAEMRVGDIVVEIAGKAVRQPDDLIGIVGDHDEGETVDIVILRGDPILRYKLIELLTQPDEFSPLLSVAILRQMQTRVTVTLGGWSIDD